VPAENVLTCRSFVIRRPGWSAADSRALFSSAADYASVSEVWLTAAMLFVLAAANGRPFWWNSAAPAAMIALWLIGSRGPTRVLQQAAAPQNAPIFWCLLALTVATGISALVAMEIEGAQALALRCVIPLFIYLAVVGLRLRPADMCVEVMAIVAGSSIPLVSGLVAFYRENGIPELQGLLYLRYDVGRMADYMEVTFGNVGHVGMYLALVAPCVFVAMSAGTLKRWAIWVSGGWMGVVIANAVVSGSRTSWAVGLAGSAIVIAVLQRGRVVLVTAALLVGCCVYVVSLDLVDETLIAERVLPSLGRVGRDTSAEERMDSIGIGWETFTNHALVGVGPGMSATYNTYDVPHQSVLMVASETGIVGGAAFLLLNIIVLWRAAKHAARAKANAIDRQRLIWIAGPAAWLVSGFMAGLTFNMNLALLWVGIAYAMLGLYGFEAAPDITPAA
jgi:hypothetical protein